VQRGRSRRCEHDRHNVGVRISAKVDYAMRALVELAAAGGGKQITAERLADAQGIPRKFLQNILLELRRAGIVASHRGLDGGHSLARDVRARGVGHHAGQSGLLAGPPEQRRQRLGRIAPTARPP